MSDDWFGWITRRWDEVVEWADKTLTQLDKAENFDDFIMILKDRVIAAYRMAFANKNIAIFGPKESGKSCLIHYLKEGVPKEDYSPTFGTVLVDRAFEIGDKSSFIRVVDDVGGEKLFRSLWGKLIEKADPEAIIYMLDGRKDWKDIEQDIQEAFADVFVHYEKGSATSRLRVFYIFVNFHDIWGKDPDKELTLASDIIAYFNRERAKRKVVKLPAVQAFPTQLAVDGKPWREVKAALDHFATDVQREAGSV